jgi:hypothetical protein
VRRLGFAILAVIVLTTAATAIAMPSRSAATPAQLLGRYAPVIVLAPGESFAPERVDGFLADSTLTAGSYDQTTCQAIGGPAALPCYAAADKAHAPVPAVYGAVFKSGGRTVLEYWFFYYFDIYTFTNPLAPVWQDHEGDWEAVAVVLDAKSKPLLVGTSRHCTGARRDWTKVRRRGDRPVIYVARGSHANYFAPGLPLIPNRCLPPQATALLEQYHVSLPEIVRVGRTIANEAVVPITATSPAWMKFTGAWGEAQYIQIPNRQAPLAYGTSPTGPAAHALWRRPLPTVLGWPRG